MSDRPIGLAARLSRLIAGVAAAVSVGVIAASLQLKGWAPLGLLPILAGIALGVALSLVAGPMAAVSRTRLVIGAIALAMLAVGVEHAWLYRDFRRQWREVRADSAEVARFRPDEPWSPREYLAHEFSPERAMLWLVDALLVMFAAACTTLVWRRLRPLTPDP